MERREIITSVVIKRYGRCYYVRTMNTMFGTYGYHFGEFILIIILELEVVVALNHILGVLKYIC